MAARHSSTSAAGPMRASLVLVLLLTAVASAHGRSVSCENKCGTPVVVNGVTVGVNLNVKVEVDAKLVVAFVDKTGKALKGEWSCPADVTAVVLVYEDLSLKVKVKAVGLVAGLVRTVLGLVLGLIKCVL